MSGNNRIQWIDASKGIGIFLVIIGHTMIDGTYRGQIYSFHMPLFFFISGYLFSVKKYHDFTSFLTARIKSLLIPYVCFSIISIILLRLLLEQPVDGTQFFKTLFMSKRNDIYFNQPLWFLTSLFTIEMIFYGLTKYVKNKYFILSLVILSGYIATSTLQVLHGTNILPWSFDQSLYYILYFGLGNFIKNTSVFDKNLKKSIPLITLSIIYIGQLMMPILYSKLFFFMNTYLLIPSSVATYVNVVLVAVVSIAFVIYVSQFLSVIGILNFIGKNSLILLALHVCLGFNLFGIILGHLNFVIPNPNLLGLTFTLATIVMLIPVTFAINKYFSFILGRNLEFSLPIRNKETVKHHISS